VAQNLIEARGHTGAGRWVTHLIGNHTGLMRVSQDLGCFIPKRWNEQKEAARRLTKNMRLLIVINRYRDAYPLQTRLRYRQVTVI